MIEKDHHIVLEVPDDADVSVEGVLGVLVLHVTHAVVLYPLQLGLTSPAKEVMDTTVEIVPIV